MLDQDDPAQLLMPGQFIPYAEKSGKILDIDRWVIKHSIELLVDTHMPSLAINISGRSFDEPTLPQYIEEQLKRCGVAPRRLLVELTETSAVSDLHDARRFIEALRQTGCRTCLDDFGTGFSSFAYLKHLQADSVKIDGLFIRDLPNDFDNQIFVKAIVAVARGMGKHTIAECVEDGQTLAMLKSVRRRRGAGISPRAAASRSGIPGAGSSDEVAWYGRAFLIKSHFARRRFGPRLECPS